MGFFSKLFGGKWTAYNERAESFAANGDWGRARGEWREAIRRIDKDASADESDREALEASLAKANGKLFDAHVAEARRNVDNGLDDRAIEFYEQAMEFTRDESQRAELLDAINRLSTKAKATARDRDAESRVKSIPQRTDMDDDPDADDYEERQTFRAILGALDEDQADVYMSLGAEFRKGYLAMQDGDIKGAIRHIKPVLRKHPDNVYLQYEMGRLYVADGKFKQANDLLKRVCKLSPDFLLAHHALIESYWGLKQYSEAERIVEKAFELDGRLLDNFRYAGETCLRSGEYDNGVELMDYALSVHPTSIDVHRLLGQLEAARGNIKRAIKAFEAGLDLQWTLDTVTGVLIFDMETALRAGELYLEHEIKLERAEELFRALVARDGTVNRWLYLENLGRALELQGDATAAKTSYVDAIAALPKRARTERQRIQKRLRALG